MEVDAAIEEARNRDCYKPNTLKEVSFMVSKRLFSECFVWTETVFTGNPTDKIKNKNYKLKKKTVAIAIRSKILKSIFFCCRFCDEN
jgi:hypothetical protein